MLKMLEFNCLYSSAANNLQSDYFCQRYVQFRRHHGRIHKGGPGGPGRYICMSVWSIVPTIRLLW